MFQTPTHWQKPITLKVLYLCGKCRFLLALCICLINLKTVGQNFEGKILYQKKYLHPETGADLTELYGPTRGYELHYFINDEFYKSYNERGQLRRMYNTNTDFYYAADRVNPKIIHRWRSRFLPDEYEIQESFLEDVILGRTCKSVVKVSSVNPNRTYYFDPNLRINYEKHLKHHYLGWSKYLKATQGAVPLKIIVYRKEFIQIYEAKSIEQIDLEYEDFKLTEVNMEIQDANHPPQY